MTEIVLILGHCAGEEAGCKEGGAGGGGEGGGGGEVVEGETAPVSVRPAGCDLLSVEVLGGGALTEHLQHLGEEEEEEWRGGGGGGG